MMYFSEMHNIKQHVNRVFAPYYTYPLWYVKQMAGQCKEFPLKPVADDFCVVSHGNHYKVAYPVALQDSDVPYTVAPCYVLPEQINKFIRNEYAFMHTDYPCNIHSSKLDLDFTDVVAAYYACKFPEKAEVIATECDGLLSTYACMNASVRVNWDSIKYKCFCKIMFNKFKQNPDLLKALLDTSDKAIVDDGTSLCGCLDIDASGNRVGRLLMNIRLHFWLRRFGIVNGQFNGY